MTRRVALPLALGLALAGCTTVNTARIPGRSALQRGERPFVLTGDLTEPYESLGPLQVTRRGVLVAGFLDPAGTTLESGFQELLEGVREMGGDGIINVRYEQTQYTPVARGVGLVLFLFPFRSQVTVRGEVVRLVRRDFTPPPPGEEQRL